MKAFYFLVLLESALEDLEGDSLFLELLKFLRAY